MSKIKPRNRPSIADCLQVGRILSCCKELELEKMYTCFEITNFNRRVDFENKKAALVEKAIQLEERESLLRNAEKNFQEKVVKLENWEREIKKQQQTLKKRLDRLKPRDSSKPKLFKRALPFNLERVAKKPKRKKLKLNNIDNIEIDEDYQITEAPTVIMADVAVSDLDFESDNEKKAKPSAWDLYDMKELPSPCIK